MEEELVIFVFGLVVTLITLTAVAVIGLSEAADTEHSREQDVGHLERALVDGQRRKRAAVAGEPVQPASEAAADTGSR